MSVTLNTHKCMNCKHYRAYYQKSVGAFMKLDYGQCTERGNLAQDKHGACAHWGAVRKSGEQRAIAPALFEQAVESIAAIHQLLEEEAEEG